MTKIFIITFLMSSNAWAKFESGTKLIYKLEGDVNKVSLSHDVYNFDIDTAKENPALIKKLKNAGKDIICYFSAGSWEDWRKPNHYSGISSTSIGKKMSGWDERWLDITKLDVRLAQRAIMDKAVAAGCDAIDPDNTDFYQQNTGFKISRQQNVDYLVWLAKAAKSKGLRIGLKNTQDLIVEGELHKYFDFNINEQCFTYKECGALKNFTKLGKAAYILEYKTTHESASYSTARFEKDCKVVKSNGYSLSVYRTQSLNGDILMRCQ